MARAIPLDTVEPSTAWMFSHVHVETILIIADPEPEANRAGTVDVLTRLGLSPAEAQVAALVGAGAAPVQVAEALSLAETTVRSYLREAYSKLDISRQGQLSLLVNQIRSIYPPEPRLRLS
jgi:DNA-binding CsgD family transcriptional regulator